MEAYSHCDEDSIDSALVADESRSSSPRHFLHLGSS